MTTEFKLTREASIKHASRGLRTQLSTGEWEGKVRGGVAGGSACFADSFLLPSHSLDVSFVGIMITHFWLRMKCFVNLMPKQRTA